MPPGSNQEELFHLVPDFDKPNRGTRHQGLVHFGGVDFPPTRQSLHSPFHQPSNLLEDEVLEEPICGVVPEVGEDVWLSSRQLLGHQVRQVL